MDNLLLVAFVVVVGLLLTRIVVVAVEAVVN